ncbi:hypothetical protein N0Q91_11560 [Sinorhizobium sp. K101]|nr:MULTISPECIES: hypothetical protein [unclassified Sinorhizobium]WEJ11175.1 hypothetical protein N0Q90_08760 [Sinorhizobium sp. M103]WEJ14225.1 hypothetical protein N0Q91_11560 [Sinorhizobium sp. K101]WEJ38159.1 hypothetical protein N0R80_08730 [Sinorhizobium sp. C101]
MLQPADDFDKQGGRIGKLALEGVGGKAEPLECFGCRSRAGHDPFVGAKVQFLHAVYKGVNLNPVLLCNKGKLLKRLRAETGALSFVADVRHALRDIADTLHDLIKPADCKGTDCAADKSLPKAAKALERAAHRLLNAAAGVFGVIPDCPEVGAALALGAFKVALILVQAGFKGD